MLLDLDGEDESKKVNDTDQGLHLWPKPVPKVVMALFGKTNVTPNKDYPLLIRCIL